MITRLSKNKSIIIDILDGSLEGKKTVLLDVDLQPQVNNSRPDVLRSQGHMESNHEDLR